MSSGTYVYFESTKHLPRFELRSVCREYVMENNSNIAWMIFISGDYFSDWKTGRNMDTIKGLCPCFKQPSDSERYEYVGE